MGVDKIENIIYTKNVHLYASAFYIFFIGKYLPLCLYTKIVFFTLKMSSTQRIYTSVQIFVHKEHSTLCEVTKMLFITLENVIYPKNIHLYASVFLFFSLKNI